MMSRRGCYKHLEQTSGPNRSFPASPNPPPSPSRATCDPTISSLSPSPPPSLLIGGEKERSGEEREGEEEGGRRMYFMSLFYVIFRFKIKHLI